MRASFARARFCVSRALACAPRSVSRQNPLAKRMDDGAREVRFAAMAWMVAFWPTGRRLSRPGCVRVGERRLSLQKAGAYEKAPTEVGALQSLVARTRFELVISALRGRRPKPLDERAIMAGMEGVEPPLTEPESAVLPLDDIPSGCCLRSLARENILGEDPE